MDVGSNHLSTDEGSHSFLADAGIGTATILSGDEQKRPPLVNQGDAGRRNPLTVIIARREFITTYLARLIFLIIIFSFCDWSELIVGKRGPNDAIGDGMHQLFAPANALLHANPRLADAALIAISFLADVSGVGLIMLAIFGSTVRPAIGLMILYLLRQSVELLSRIPAPDGMIWRYPGFPSLLVDYHVMSDFFFSGHTAIIVYAIAELSRLRQRWVTAVGVASALFVMVALFSLRAHYTMDVYAGVVTALLAFLSASYIAKALEPIIEGGLRGSKHD